SEGEILGTKTAAQESAVGAKVGAGTKGLSDTDRIAEARKLVKRPLSAQQEAVIDAHNIGKDTNAVGNYNWAQIRAKNKILRDAGFSPSEIRSLMENG